ncbi:MAG: hypothetical protein EB112_05615 [Actinobacteria bacterium]|nr:hypothetical protein [Actinomycetota bacterium]
MNEVKVKRKSPWRLVAGAVMALSAAAIVGQGVLASLNATAFNTVAQNVNSGTLKLTLADNGAGFTQNISNLAPGDVVNRYVTIKNDGSLEGINLSLKTTQTGTPSLISDGVGAVTNKALRLTVSSCPVAWNPTTGLCNGTEALEIATTPLNILGNATNFTSASMSAGAFKYLKMSLQLPDQNETTINGTLPSNTVQGGTVAITYTFDFAQRVATTTNS